MASTISAGLTNSTALVYTADTSGVLQLQTNGTTTAVTIDTSQNVGIGVTPSAQYNTIKALQVGALGATIITGNTVAGGTSSFGQNFYTDVTLATYKYATSSYPATTYNQYNGQHQWFTAPSGTAGNAITFTQAMTLNNSGQFMLGTTSPVNYGLQTNSFSGSSYNGIVLVETSGASGCYFSVFQNNGTVLGTISRVGTTNAVAYNTMSDRRLKTNIVDLTNSGTVIDSLKPRAFTWIADNSADAGFIADEIQQVLPKAVTGQPNATKEEEYEVTPAVKDEQGNITTPAVMGTRTVPVYQMIDASQPELIAYLVAEVQSLRARLKAANIA